MHTCAQIHIQAAITENYVRKNDKQKRAESNESKTVTGEHLKLHKALSWR